MVVTAGAKRRAKARHIITIKKTQHRAAFYRPDALPVAQ